MLSEKSHAQLNNLHTKGRKHKQTAEKITKMKWSEMFSQESLTVRKNLVHWGGQIVKTRRNALKLYLCPLSLLPFSAWRSILVPATHTHILDSSPWWCHLLIFGKAIMCALRLPRLHIRNSLHGGFRFRVIDEKAGLCRGIWCRRMDSCPRLCVPSVHAVSLFLALYLAPSVFALGIKDFPDHTGRPYRELYFS